MRYVGLGTALVSIVLWTAVPSAAQVEVGRFDYGKMWTFEYPPAEYFSETYGFDATPAIVGDELYLKGKEHIYCIAKP